MAQKQKQKEKEKTRPKVEAAQRSIEKPPNLRREIKDLDDVLETGFVDMAEKLNIVESQRLYEEWNFEDMLAYVTTDLRLGWRKARYLINIEQALLRCGGIVTREEIRALGWTKAKEIATLMEEENAREWLEIAQNTSSRELEEKVRVEKKKQRGDETGKKAKSRILLPDLEEDQARAIQTALEEARAELDTKDDALALCHVCVEWLSYTNRETGTIPLSDMIRWIESIYDVKLSYETEGEEKERAEITKKVKAARKKQAVKQAAEAFEDNGEEAEDEDEAPAPPVTGKAKTVRDMLRSLE